MLPTLVRPYEGPGGSYDTTNASNACTLVESLAHPVSSHPLILYRAVPSRRTALHTLSDGLCSTPLVRVSAQSSCIPPPVLLL